MIANKLIRLFLLLGLCSIANSSLADSPKLQAFAPGSYQKILAQQAQQPFVLFIWSIDCPSCVKDMQLIKSLHDSHPQLRMILLATDELAASEQVKGIISKHQLSDLENWIFADDNIQKLNYEIDPQWYGELPRTYFFDASHQRTGISGVIKQADFEKLFAKISQKP